jgi:hypothetical protein
MFGFFAGSLALVLMLKVAFGHHYHRRGWRHHGGGFGHHHHGGMGRGGWRHGGGWRRYALYSLFERLDATPGQEKVITGAMDELRAKLAKMRGQFAEQRTKAATAFRAEVLTPEQAEGVFAPFGTHFDELRAASAEAMRKIHEALDERQRGVLANLVENGWGFGGAGRC